MASLNLIVSFASAARQGSFAAAARDLGLTPSAVAKNVARLESQLGVRLFHRTTRQVTLSPDGTDLYARCLRILEDVESLESAAAHSRGGVRGTLRIDMPVTYGRQVVLPVLTTLLARHPELRIDARFSDRLTDIVKEGLDAAVRIGPLPDSGFIGRRFDQQVIWTCASPDYLEKRSVPRTPADLQDHTCVVFRLPTSGRDRPWQFLDGADPVTLAPDSGIRLGEGEALVRAAVDGLGVIQVPSYMAEQAVERGDLVEVLQPYRPAPLPISLIYPSQRLVPARVRVLAAALLGLGKMG